MGNTSMKKSKAPAAESGSGSKTASTKPAYDVEAVKQDLRDLMNDPDYDDGSYAPIFIRLGWHSSGTYSKSDTSHPGGSNGATMRHKLEMDDPENKGLENAREILEKVKAKHPEISYSDLWILAAYTGLEMTNGPKIEFTPGRSDKGEDNAISPGRLPHAEEGLDEGLDSEGRINGWEKLAGHIREVFNRMGFNDQEIVALISGGHMYGRCHREFSGYMGAWVEKPTEFNNEFAADLVQDEWMCVTHDTKVNGVPIPDETRPAKGKRQYMSKWEPSTGDIMEVSDEKLGQFRVAQGWLNVRKTQFADSYVIDQPVRDTLFNVVALRQVGKGLRGQLDVGGWASVVSTNGEEVLLERVGDWVFPTEATRYRVLIESPVQIFKETDGQEVVREVAQREITVTEHKIVDVEVFGKVEDGWVKLVDKNEGGLLERVQPGYNDAPKKAIKKMQVKYQMMLPSDMCMLWDEKFREHLQRYADDEEVLKKEFGDAYKKLTELGCDFSPCPAANIKAK